MIETAAVTTPFQYGPIITGLLFVLIAAFGWAIRRVITRIDGIGTKVDGLSDRVIVIETKQNLVAKKTGITDQQLKHAEAPDE